MASFNQITLLGNLTRDPQLRYLPSQTAICDFGMAVNRKFKTASGEEREEVMFIDCSLFGPGAEVVNKYCQKGQLLFVQGRLKLDTWEDKQGGGKRSKHVVVVETFQLMPRRDGAAAGNGGDAPSRPAARPATGRPAPAQQAPAEPPYGEEQQFKEDDIPF